MSASVRERERVVCAGIFVSLENGQLHVSHLNQQAATNRRKRQKGTDRQERRRETDEIRKGGNPARRRSPTNHTYHKISFSRSCGSSR